MIMSAVWLVVALVIIGLIFWAVLWFIDYVGLPDPFNKVAKVILALVALVFVILVLLQILNMIPGAPIAVGG